MPTIFVQVLFGAILGLTLAGAAWRVRLWLRGRAASVPIWHGLMRLPRRYLHDVHEAVARDPFSARMHMAVAGGFVTASLIFLVDLYLVSGPVTRALGVVACAVMAVGVALVAIRRFGAARDRTRSRGEWNRLAIALAAMALGLCGWFVLVGPDSPSIVTALVVVLLALGGIELITGLAWGGPMRHAFAGALHLAFHPRPERFDRPDARSSGLKKVDLEAARLGAAKPEDFAWNQILGFDACVQCGRCEAMCPAFAAGQPLNPKALINDLAAASGLLGLAGRYSGSPHPGAAASRASLVAEGALWSCTTCRACVQECPMMIEHVDAVIDLRRHIALEVGRIPGKATQALTALRASDDPLGRPPAERFAWAVDLALPRVAETGATDVLLWVGDAGFNRRSHRTLRALVALLRTAKIDFAVLGEDERDCGDAARRLGEEAIFQDLARRNIALLSRYRFSRIVTADPHAYHSLKNEYPAMGGVWTVLHHTTFLAGLLAEGRITVQHRLEKRVAYHDPCYLGRYNGEIAAPRAIIERIAPLVEMERSGLRSRCCGGGGGAPLTDIPGQRRIPDMRMDDARATGAEIVAVACPNCMTMLEGVSGVRPDVADVAELLAECAAMEQAR